MQQPDALLLAALRAAPRAYRMPPLPLDADAAIARGAETALAFAIEAARIEKESGSPPPPDMRDLFTRSLAELIREALARDPGFQALVLRAQDAEVDEYVRLSAQSAADRRAVRAATDAIAHPGKMSKMAAGAMRDALSRLHGLAAASSWTQLGRAVEGLLVTPQGFPGEAGKAKDEWDAAIVRSGYAGSAADIVLLAEVKSSPAAATPDFSRLHRGLQRLAHASAAGSYAFASADGDVRVTGESLRRLQPHGRSLPPHVIYCCSAPAESQPQVLSAASKAVLLAEASSLSFAHQTARGGSPRHENLAPVWEDLTTAPRLRTALHQHDTARAVREAMLHPEDLVAAVAEGLGS